MIGCEPLVRVVVVYVATPLPFTVTTPPVSATPASLKVTDPVAVAVTVAVKVTDWPGVDGFALDVSVVDDAVFTGDTLFKDAVGGGDLEQVRASVMDVFMALPDSTRVLPGHTDETTIGREREANPFVRVWSGAEPEGSEAVEVGGRQATLVVWSPDYDGKGKAWVRFDDGTDAIVGGSRIQRV